MIVPEPSHTLANQGCPLLVELARNAHITRNADDFQAGLVSSLHTPSIFCILLHLIALNCSFDDDFSRRVIRSSSLHTSYARIVSLHSNIFCWLLESQAVPNCWIIHILLVCPV